MAVFSYVAVISLIIQTAYCLSPSNSGRSIHISLSQRESIGSPHLTRRTGVAAEGVNIDAEFWFADFSVGASSNLSLLIDTGSGDVVLNPGIYVPGDRSQNLSTAFENEYGTTSSNGTGNGEVTGELYRDQVSFGSLTATQVIGSATGNSPIPADGIVGFSGQVFSQFPNSTNSTPFFQTLCNQNVVSECKFGLALTESGSGTLALGELDTSLYTGDLVVTPIIEEWILSGDLAINGEIVATELIIELDSGTATIVGPIDAVAGIFNMTGIQAVLQSTSEGDILTGYFPCDEVPTVGFSFPSQKNVSLATNDSSSPISNNSTIFNIPANSWAAANNGNNNCTAVLSGQNYVEGLWVLGQAFFQGLYIDHNLENGTVGLAPLNSGTSGNTTAISTTSSPKPTLSTSGAGQIQSSWWLVLGAAIMVFYFVVQDLYI